MEFFDSRDWLGMAGPYAFRFDHLLFIFLFLALGIFLAIFLRNKDKKIIERVIVSLWAFGTAVVMFYYITTYILCAVDPTGHPFVIEGMLPLHSCLMFMYVFPFAIWCKNKIIKTMARNFLVVVNMIIGFITLFVGCPPKGSSALSFVGVQSMVIHCIEVIVPIIMLATKYYDLKKEDIKWGLLTFAILGVAVYIFDAIAHCDYFYFYDGRTFGILYEISENVPHIVWTLIVVTCYVLTALIIHFLVVGIKAFVSKKQSAKKLIKF